MKIIDESGDKKYFTIIPNYILNHSTLWDREVYVQMKRITGEDGTCWTSRKTLSKQCGMSIRRLDKSLLYLIEHKWIKKIGVKKINTKGGEQDVNEYRVADLWKLNIDYYEGIAQDAHPIRKGGARLKPKVVHGNDEGGASGAHKEEPIKNITIKEDTEADASGKDINDIICLFKEINPSYIQLLKRKVQRDAISRLVKVLGREKLEVAIKYAEKSNTMPFSPVITTPIQLEEKLGALRAFVQKEMIKIKNNKVIKL